ncbi:MAG: threonine-phosphate decarboxylase CobD [Alphaproteobacteria bacterium]|nr:threonine-phosphate decarboxylase CobD [Alphaproteobacteria bacterium]
MLIRSHIGVEPLAHGGDLAAARQMFPDAPEPFIDLSTGINPHPYPLPVLPPDIFARLPDRASVRRLAAVAARSYGAPSADHVLPAPGTQILLPQVAMLAPAGRAAILRTTYAEHGRAAALAGHDVTSVNDPDALARTDLAVVVNPNNPDGVTVPRDVLLRIAGEMQKRGGLLVVDEAFADVTPGQSLASDVGHGNIVVLRSFGKFYGLAGLRLGFAIASPELINRLDAMLGPWAVAGPSILIGESALADRAWQAQTLDRLTEATARLDTLLQFASLEIVGGTSLYRLTRSADAERIFQRLGRAGILVRRFSEEPSWLRFGLPPAENDWRRLTDALSNR